jgi:hypothetical protein
MEVDYNMLVENHVNCNILIFKITLLSGGAIIKKLILQCGSENFKFSHLQF